MTMRQLLRHADGREGDAAAERLSVRVGRVLVLVVTPAVAVGALLLGGAIALARLLG